MLINNLFEIIYYVLLLELENDFCEISRNTLESFMIAN